MGKLVNLQLMMVLFMAVGFILKKKKIVSAEGQKNITDFILMYILPCNIIKSFMIEFNMDILKEFLWILVLSLGLELFSMLLAKVLYRKVAAGPRSCMQYATVVSNAGFMGFPVCEGLFGSIGLTYASIFVIPERIVMWTAGVAYYAGGSDKKAVIKRLLTHPCIIACDIGLILMITQIKLPAFLHDTIVASGSCTTALSMCVVGMILADNVKIKEIFDRRILFCTLFRLVLIPLVMFGVCSFLPIDNVTRGVVVLLAAMPAGATTSILAAKYNADANFGVRLVIFTTVASLFTTAIWSFLLSV